MVKLGYYAEAERKRILERDGWIVFRVSGSIGPMDLIAVRKDGNSGFEVRLEQVKSTNQSAFYFDSRSKEEWERLYNYKGQIPSYFVILFKRKGWKVVEVDNPLPPKSIKLGGD